MKRKVKVLFVCHGNICRSAMAEFIMRNMLSENGIDDVSVSSCGVSSEEEGNDIYPEAKRMLRMKGVPFSHHRAHRITDREFRDADMILCMDRSNLRALERRFGHDDRVSMILDRDVDDPWYSGDFETAYGDIEKGCRRICSDICRDLVR